jgi:molybdopterin-dependent oxidoreductase alpha subunit
MNDQDHNLNRKEIGLKVSKPKKVAAGVPSILNSMKHISEGPGMARGMKALFSLNQKDGFTCPGCAWPDPDDYRSALGEYCENGAKAVAEEATLKSIGAEFFINNSIAELAKLTDYEIGKKGRITDPMYLAKGALHYHPLSWNEAFEKIAVHLNKLNSPDEAVFYTSGRTSNEAAFLYQLFIREFGTNNLPDCSNLCHESSGVAMIDSIGIGKGTVTLDDFNKAEVIMILGQNPGTNHPRMLSALEKAKKNGAGIIAVNPLYEAGLIAFNNPQTVSGLLGIKSDLTDLYLQVRLNGDMALIKALEKLLIEEEELSPGTVLDAGFIKDNTEGFNELKLHLNQLSFSFLAKESGIEEAEIKKAVDILKNKKKIIMCWAMGITQHKNGVDTIKEFINLLLLKGSIGKPGAGACPVRGHSNVQGDRTMGINEKPPKAFLDNLQKYFGFEPPQEHGLDVVDSIKAMMAGKVKVFFAMGGNFLSASPDTDFTEKALRKCKLTVHVSTKLNRSHLVHGEEAIILPCLSRSDLDIVNGEEQIVSVENSMGVIQMSKGILPPVSDNLLSEPEIVCRLAKETLGERSKVDWKLYSSNYDHIRKAIESVIPGFENYNERVRNPGGFYLPNPARDGIFKTGSGKAKFNVAELPAHSLGSDEFMMFTIRSHDQYNTTIYGLDDRYRGINNFRRVIMMNKYDIAKSGLTPGEEVNLYNYFDGVERKAPNFTIIEYNIPEGCTATYFPEANILVPLNSVADKSNTPTSKFVIIKIRKVGIVNNKIMQ